MKQCPRCHQVIERDETRFCPRCGALLVPSAKPAPAPEPSSPVKADQPRSGTQALPIQVRFESLAEGELLEDRYIVQAFLGTGPGTGIHRYRLTPVPWAGRRLCPGCGNEEPAEEAFCTQCGLALEDGVEVTYLAFEARDPAPFAVERRLLEQPPQVLGLVQVVDLFELHRDFESFSRHWLVVENLADARALAVEPRPVSWERMLSLGLQLAEALHELHRLGVALPHLDADQVCLLDEQAKIWRFGRAKILEEVGPQDEQGDILALGRLLNGLVEGATTPPPPQVAEVTRQMLETPQSYTSTDVLVRDLRDALSAIRRPAGLYIRSWGLSHVGRMRALNEDSLSILEHSAIHEDISRPVGLYIVADGMGGHAGGEVASRMAVEAIVRYVVEHGLFPQVQLEAASPPAEEILRTLKEAVAQANRSVHEARKVRGTDMGTTLVAALVIGSAAYILHVGDSRCYVFSDHLEQITTDHSLVERLIAGGQLSREEARTHPQRNVIVRSIGDKPQVVPDTCTLALQPGWRLLLCSDGLNGMIEDEEIERILLQNPEPALACQSLIDAANQAGGHDNVTVIVAQLTLSASTRDAGVLRNS